MERRRFINTLGLAALAPSIMTLRDLNKLSDELAKTEKMPSLFVGHGNPMNAISDNSFTKGWSEIITQIGSVPKAILCISAHWETKGTLVTAMDNPRTIHDFYGFPKELFEVEYPSPGAPEFAGEVRELVTSTAIEPDYDWGLDHGTWSVLVKMYPDADIPVLQLSLDYTKPAQYHYDLARELKNLRERGVLIVGSGNIVHNLMMAKFEEDPKPYDWALEFDDQAKSLIEGRKHTELINYEKLGRAAQLSIPTPEHYLPLLYILALQDDNENANFFNEEMAFGSGSMRSVIIH